VIEHILSVLPKNADYGFYRTSAGAELDLVIQLGSERWAIEIKRTLSLKLSKGSSNASEDLKATHRFFVYSGTDEFPISENAQAIGLLGILRRIKEGF
jgi:predicted AAA+ superfamily ATPase